MNAHLLVGSSPLGIVPRVLGEIKGTRILDVGCGCGVYGFLLRNKWQDTPPGSIQFRDFAKRDPANDQPELLVGVDVQLESVRRCAKHSIYDYLALCRVQSLPFPENYVDTILCVEVLEHLPKDEALMALSNFEKVARQRIIVTVPKKALNLRSGQDDRDFINIETDDPDLLEWMEAERHKSAFTLHDLRKLGFRVGRRIRGSGRAPYDMAMKLWENYGFRSGQILAVKDLMKPDARLASNYLPSPARFTESFPDFR